MQDHADSTAQHSTGSKLRRAVILALEIAIILPSSCYFLFLGAASAGLPIYVDSGPSWSPSGAMIFTGLCLIASVAALWTVVLTRSRRWSKRAGYAILVALCAMVPSVIGAADAWNTDHSDPDLLGFLVFVAAPLFLVGIFEGVRLARRAQ